ncbi:MAG: hypothetical protein K2Q10_07620, partial [Rhodospirillales bacterium]|nr:hypothetical protein [Rhodospirillales bacterium]
ARIEAPVEPVKTEAPPAPKAELIAPAKMEIPVAPVKTEAPPAPKVETPAVPKTESLPTAKIEALVAPKIEVPAPARIEAPKPLPTIVEPFRLDEPVRERSQSMLANPMVLGGIFGGGLLAGYIVAALFSWRRKDQDGAYPPY